MHRSGNDFSYVHNLKRGKHAFKFIVDDEWRFAPDQPTVADIEGRINNFIDVSDFAPYRKYYYLQFVVLYSFFQRELSVFIMSHDRFFFLFTHINFYLLLSFYFLSVGDDSFFLKSKGKKISTHNHFILVAGLSHHALKIDSVQNYRTT